MRDVFEPFEELLRQYDSHDGRLERRAAGYKETEFDFAFLLPTRPGKTLFTLGDLRALVEAGRELKARREDNGNRS